MICLVIAGAKGTGKTTYVKSMLEQSDKKALFIYDINNEYGEFYDKPFLKQKDFIDLVYNVRNAVIVFEEATSFFNNRSFDERTVEILQRSRHTNNLVVFVFHSLRGIPRYIIDLINYYVIFKTNDTIKLVEQKFDDPNMIEVVKEVKNSPDRHYYKIFTANTLPGVES